MKQHIEFVTKIVNLKEQQTAKGFLYRFSVPITEMDGEEQLTEWLQCAIFLKERDPRITGHTGQFHFSGELKVKKAWGSYPQGLNLFGFEIKPVLGNVYRLSKPKSQPEPHSTSNGMNDPSPRQVAAHEKIQQEQEQRDLLFEPMSTEVPF